MMLPEPFHADQEHLAIDLPGAHALFTTRRGGFSSGAYTSLNLGRLTDDRPDSVRRNRAALQTKVGRRLDFVRQVHGAEVRLISATTAGVRELPYAVDGWEIPEAADVGDLLEADGQVTALPGVAPVALVADCLPIAVAGDGAVAMLHAGWRGLAAGVVAEGVRAMRGLGAEGPLVAAIGPGAGPCCYEVGEEVHDAFSEHPGAVHRGRNLDLKAVARHELGQAGVSTVHDIGLCTICSDRSLFFSHRRDRGVTGRQAGITWLT